MLCFGINVKKEDLNRDREREGKRVNGIQWCYPLTCRKFKVSNSTSLTDVPSHSSLKRSCVPLHCRVTRTNGNEILDTPSNRLTIVHKRDSEIDNVEIASTTKLQHTKPPTSCIHRIMPLLHTNSGKADDNTRILSYICAHLRHSFSIPTLRSTDLGRLHFTYHGI